MHQSRPLVAVLLVGIVAALGVVAFVSTGGGEPGGDEVAIRVGDVEVTFAELDLRREASEATAGVVSELLESGDTGMPSEVARYQQLMFDVFAPYRDLVDEEVGFLSFVVAEAAALAAAVEAGATPTDADIARRAEQYEQARASLLAGDGSLNAIPRAVYEAERAALSPEEYTEWRRLSARESLARDELTDDMEMAPAEVGVMPLIVSMEVAQEFEIDLHPSLGVSAEEIREHLDAQARSQRALLELGSAFLPEEWTSVPAAD